ncbi:MAG: hypothetical protein V4496_07010 [Pseudomonadota bacterium]
MRTKGNILLIMLVMLLFASAVLLQLSVDNYLAHLIDQHVENLSNARVALNQGFKKLSTASINPACYSAAAICQIKISGIAVKYALCEYQQDEQENSYLQYSLEAKAGTASIRLRVVVEQPSSKVVSWLYL